MQTIKLFIICASSSEPLGGMEQHILGLCQELGLSSNLEIVLAGAAPLLNACKETIGPNSSVQIRFIKLPCQRSRRSPTLNYALYKHLKKENPDLVHCHGYKALYLAKNAKALITASDTITRKQARDRFKTITTVHGTKSKTDILRSADRIVCVSRTIQNTLHEAGLESTLIENGIAAYDGPHFSKQSICARYNLDPDKPLALSLGRLAAVKNFAMLMKAFQALDANLLILGEGPERTALEALQSHNCVLGGHQSDARAYLKAIACLIISSIREGFSLSMVEALQANTPVLSSKVSGAQDLLPDSCLLDISDVGSLQQSLKSCINQLENLKQKSKPAFRYAANTLSQQTMSRNLEQVYRELCNEQA
jgi:glycosyltransferase involved in cell wall biosynthesis